MSGAILLGFKVYLILYVCLSDGSGNPNTSIVSKLNENITPHIQPLQLDLHTKDITHTVQTSINEKVKELTPYFQDNDDKQQKQGEETKVKENMPRAGYQRSIMNINDNAVESVTSNLDNFINKQNQIKMILDKEPVSDNTKQFINNMLRDLTANMFQTQCPQIRFRNSDLMTILRAGSLEGILALVEFDKDGHCYVGEMLLDEEFCYVLKEPYKHCQFQGRHISENECKKILDMANVNRTCIISDEEVPVSDCDSVNKILKEKLNDRLNDFANKLFLEKPKYYNENKNKNKNKHFSIYDMVNAVATTFLRKYDTDKHAVRCNLLDSKNKY